MRDTVFGGDTQSMPLIFMGQQWPTIIDTLLPAREALIFEPQKKARKRTFFHLIEI